MNAMADTAPGRHGETKGNGACGEAPWGRCKLEACGAPLPEPKQTRKEQLYCSKRCRDRAARLMAQARLRDARKDGGAERGPTRPCNCCGRPFEVTPQRRLLCAACWGRGDADTARAWAGV